MKKCLLRIITLMVLSLAANPLHAFQVVSGTGYSYVKVSLSDVNRIVCPVNVGNVVYSTEKQIQVKVQGKNVFVKFIPVQKVDPQTGQIKISYSKIPRDIYIECGGRYFSLILIPKHYSAQTIVLKLPERDLKAASQFERANGYEKTIMFLVKAAYMETPPQGYKAEDVNEKISSPRLQKIILYLRRVMKGSHFSVREYLIEAKTKVSLDETQFLNLVFHPIAVSIVKPDLQKGETTRMFIVTQNNAEQGELK